MFSVHWNELSGYHCFLFGRSVVGIWLRKSTA